MLQAMFSGVSGLQAHQTKMNEIGNNIANVNTVGFKAGRVNFEDQLSQTLSAATGPTSTSGGQDPTQIGLGVLVGGVDTLQTQGNLQTTGKSTDLAIQGAGFFLVGAGQSVAYTRDGSFDLDGSGTLVNSATGARLLGYQADAAGVVDSTVPVTPASALKIPIGSASNAKQTTEITTGGNLDAGSAIVSTKVDFTGNLDNSAAAGASVQNSATVFDWLGNAHTVQTTLTNPVSGAPLTGPGVPAGATRSWDIALKVDGSTVYDSTAGKSRIYDVGGNWVFADTTSGATLGPSIQMDGAAGDNHGPQIPGGTGASPFTLSLNYGALTDTTAASSVAAAPDGQTGSSPTWGTSIQVFDSLGQSHLVTFKYTRALLGANPPVGATSRWEWTATENGQPLGDSTTAGNTPIFFGSNGQLVSGATQTVTIAPTGGATTPVAIKVSNDKLTGVAADSSASVTNQDGYQAGALDSFTIGSDGKIMGLYSNGQSRALGQVALADFANPGGLEKLGGNLLRATDDSGAPQVGASGEGGRGKLNSGFLEMSNVDLSTEFTNLIVTERGFEANTRIITTVDGLLQEVLNLKR